MSAARSGEPSRDTAWDRSVLDPHTGRSWHVRRLRVAPERWLRAPESELLQLIDGPHLGGRGD